MIELPAGIIAIIALALLAMVSAMCAPLAHNHSVKEGRFIQGAIFYYTFNALSIALILMIMHIATMEIVK